MWGGGVRYLGSTTASQLRFIVAQQQQQQREGGGSIDVAESSLNCCQFNGKLNTKATGKWPESDILSLSSLNKHAQVINHFIASFS